MSIDIQILSWGEAKVHAKPIRRRVFIEEQSVPEEMEWDDMDSTAVHALAFDETGMAVGYARLLTSTQLGRMAVLPDYRGRGTGTALLQALEAVAINLGYDSLYLHAQIQALTFYERLGYQTKGAAFDEAGIPHMMMTKVLAKQHD